VSLGRYILVVVVVALSVLAAAWLVGLRRLEAIERGAVAYGGGLALLNAIAAYALVRWSEHRSANALVKAVLGGTLVRMALLLVAVVAGIRGLGLPAAPLVAALLTLFVVFLALEIAVVSRQRVSAPEGGR
jgi:hypothetical protein